MAQTLIKIRVYPSVVCLSIHMQGWFLITAGVPIAFNITRILPAVVPSNVVITTVHNMVLVVV